MQNQIKLHNTWYCVRGRVFSWVHVFIYLTKMKPIPFCFDMFINLNLPSPFLLGMYHRTWCSLVDDCTCSVMTRATKNVGKWLKPSSNNDSHSPHMTSKHTARKWAGYPGWLYEYKLFLFIIRKFTMPRHGIFRNPQTLEFLRSSLLCIWYSLCTSPASNCRVHKKRDKKLTLTFSASSLDCWPERVIIYCCSTKFSETKVTT